MNETAEFMEMVKRHDRGLRALAYRLLHDRVAMDDVMQDAYLNAFRALSSFRGEAQTGTWLYRIVYNACLDRLRCDRRRPEVSLEVVVEARTVVQTEGDPGEWVPERSALAVALASVSPEQRAAVLLVDATGLSYDEAADVLGVRPGTIASRLHQARSVLRQTLSERRDHETV
jgi:RNA polymerase sigma-70 factor, ECF subfamily